MGKPKLEPHFVRPSNSERAADPAYWFLRGVQSALQIGEPPSFDAPPPTVETIQFVEPFSRAPFGPQTVVALPKRENLYLALSGNGRQMHLLAGPSLGGGQTFELDRTAVALAAGSASAFLLLDNGTVARLPLISIVGQLRGRPDPPIPMREVAAAVEIGGAWPLEDGGQHPLLVCPRATQRDCVVLLDPSLRSAGMVEALDTRLQIRSLALGMSHQLRASVSVASAFAFGPRIGLFDAKGSRVFFIDPFESSVKPKLMSGRAEASRQASFGPLGASGTLPRATSAAVWALGETSADAIAVMARLQPTTAPLDGSKSLPTSPDARHEFKRQLLEQASFLVLHDGASGLVTTCSFPVSDPRFQKLISENHPMVLPVCGSLHASPMKAVDRFSNLQKAVIGFEQVVQGPGSSVMFWSPASSRAVLLHALGEAYDAIVANKEHIDAVNAAFGRTDDDSR